MNWIRTATLAGLMSASLLGGTAAAQKSVLPSKVTTQARLALQGHVKRDGFMGTVLIARNGKVLFREGYGMADAAWSVANTGDTKFNIGSLTKQFTGLAILQLAEAGKIQLSESITRYYTNAPESWRNITIAHVLAHRSGIAGPSGPADYPRGIDTTYTARELVDIVAKKPTEFAPGSRFKYSNAGYYVLGYIIETVSGQSYSDYLQTHVFAPLGMKDSGFDSVREVIPRKAMGYGGAAGRRQYADRVDWSLAFSAGRLYSTVDDLLRWDQGIAANRLLNSASAAALQTPNEEGYNFGWFVDRKDGKLRLYHEGSNPGYASFIYRFPEDGLLVVVLSNVERAPVREIADELLKAANAIAVQGAARP